MILSKYKIEKIIRALKELAERQQTNTWFLIKEGPYHPATEEQVKFYEKKLKRTCTLIRSLRKELNG